MKIFRPLNRNKPHLILGLDIIADSEERFFPYGDILTPAVGYVQDEREEGV